ncbi:hypothetical protein TPHA_0J01850 [Tetrapisispora phaffii CBS 4417]|uniref:GIY-YIG domain-containing protein n=1 Tax=Tetrapisispora phaffii (strain ATCC 24235 / CBS 4417 / NBRC 1672 / NRRL Y-8282 / UCD 70-5) TaxID=1071381 RepID=G8BYR4_TETPH|nr:hypothetical protein TPHA_0J01850 [Tetrapisispora phaffii CBS 4417]CCE65006.1 hypothetical protein TPHA_0J01850 [Tetrapisispora phaffii CBS 4417]
MSQSPSPSDDQIVSSQTRKRTYPTLYCCYLLQSIAKRRSFYIGSTPHPVRRLRQHNGILSRGGAYRTKRDGTRPWEMIVVVYGFPNKIAAYQYEHAWQHAYSTHFIAKDERIVSNKTAGRTLHHKLGVIRQLMNNEYFQHMNLNVHFFNSDILEMWDANKFDLTITDLEDDQITLSQQSQNIPNVLEADDIINISDKNLQLVTEFYDKIIQKEMYSKDIYKEKLIYGSRTCQICSKKYDYTSEDDDLKPYILFCPNKECDFESHLSCLYAKCMSSSDNEARIIPISCHCSSCNISFNWTKYIEIATLIKSLDK